MSDRRESIPVIVVHLQHEGRMACTGDPIPWVASEQYEKVPRYLCVACQHTVTRKDLRTALAAALEREADARLRYETAMSELQSVVEPLEAQVVRLTTERDELWAALDEVRVESRDGYWFFSPNGAEAFIEKLPGRPVAPSSPGRERE